jgi:hypothetical protein
LVASQAHGICCAISSARQALCAALHTCAQIVWPEGLVAEQGVQSTIMHQCYSIVLVLKAMLEHLAQLALRQHAMPEGHEVGPHHQSPAAAINASGTVLQQEFICVWQYVWNRVLAGECNFQTQSLGKGYYVIYVRTPYSTPWFGHRVVA